MRTPRNLWLMIFCFGSGAMYGQLPDGPHKDTVLRLCGTCHSANIVLGRNMTREQWGETVSNMIAKGAKGSPDDFNDVVNYLATALGPKPATEGAPRRRGGGFSIGPANKQIVDVESAKRGRAIYYKECITCHGPNARGPNANAGPVKEGTDLVRSLVLLHDRYGSEIGPFLKKGHPTQSGAPASSFTMAQVQDLSNFLHQQVDDTLRSGPYNKPINVLTGDAKAGEAYFNGAGQCSTCHSPTGDLAHIASKYDPVTLQQKFLFPRSTRFGPGAEPAKPVMVTVTEPDGQAVSGELVRIDNFTIALRDSDGQYRSFTRTPELKVQKSDPYEAHDKLLDQYTDKNMHDLEAYLETLK